MKEPGGLNDQPLRREAEYDEFVSKFRGSVASSQKIHVGVLIGYCRAECRAEVFRDHTSRCVFSAGPDHPFFAKMVTRDFCFFGPQAAGRKCSDLDFAIRSMTEPQLNVDKWVTVRGTRLDDE